MKPEGRRWRMRTVNQEMANEKTPVRQEVENEKTSVK